MRATEMEKMRQVKTFNLIKWGNLILFTLIALYVAAYNYEGIDRGIQVMSVSFLFLLYTPFLSIKVPAVKHLRWFLLVLLFVYSFYRIAYGFPNAPEPSRWSL